MLCRICQEREAFGPGTGLCDGCWELEHRILNRPDLAIKILSNLGYEVKGRKQEALKEPGIKDSCMKEERRTGVQKGDNQH